MATSKKQKSGIVSGFIIGLITGLVIAVIVAFMVTKTPIPFAGRKDRPASTPTPAVAGASASDPNQSLYGKETPRPTLPVTADNPANTCLLYTSPLHRYRHFLVFFSIRIPWPCQSLVWKKKETDVSVHWTNLETG